jgi:hypothetical protein
VKYKLLTLAFSMLAYLLQAQTIKTYSGPYGKGNATYQYYEDNNGERVYNGSFAFKGLEGTIKIIGAYKNGKRNGNWECTLTNYFYIAMTMSGTIQVNYLNGNREGISTYSLSKDINAFDVSGKETETARINFKNNIPSGEYFFSLANKVNSNAGIREAKTIIKGSFDESGYKTGEWNIQSVNNNLPTEEVKRYNKGYCYWYISRISSTGEINKKFDSTEFANNYFKKQEEIFQKGNLNYALGFPKGSNISDAFDLIGNQGVNAIVDNTGDRFTIAGKEGMPIAQFIGNLGWDAFLNSKYDKCIELSNKALSYDSTFLYAKLNIALAKLKQKSPEYLSYYYSATSCCKNIENRKETLEAGIQDINDLSQKEEVPNTENAIKILEAELSKIRNDEKTLAVQKEKEIKDKGEKEKKEQQHRIELANSDYGKIISEIRIELKRWERKSQFESDTDYQNRLRNEKESQFLKIRDSVLQKFKSLNQSLSTDNLLLVGQIIKYDPENKILIIQPKMLGGGRERRVLFAVSSKYNASFSDDYNKVARNNGYSLNISSELAKAMYSMYGSDDNMEILIIPKEFTLYNNYWCISKAFIIFNFDHSPGTVKSIIATDKSVSMEVDVFIPAKRTVLLNIPSRTKSKTVELLKFSDLENDYKQSRTLPEKIYYYYWTLDSEPNFSKEKVKVFNISIADIEDENN